MEEGHLGQKAGSGVYRAAAGDYTPRCSGVLTRLVEDVRCPSGLTATSLGERFSPCEVLREMKGT